MNIADELPHRGCPAALIALFVLAALVVALGAVHVVVADTGWTTAPDDEAAVARSLRRPDQQVSAVSRRPGRDPIDHDGNAHPVPAIAVLAAVLLALVAFHVVDDVSREVGRGVRLGPRTSRAPPRPLAF